MLTVKLMKATEHMPSPSSPPDTQPHTVFSTKIVEAVEVDIHCLRPGELWEVTARLPAWHPSGQINYAFYIAERGKPRPSGFGDDVDFYYGAYVENSNGSTVDQVRF